ncbi:inositol monophosphatase family protein [Xenorhabdus eapokensis]|uniref:Nus factor SuhB n=1 Tax=Xenorhabdus eapokensis TaxID=1873482 RepID=A0A1Q5TGL7_9GAMM|nr:inositol monophosphatase family protein [Xenorhabdus eapokensis]OKO99364.1 histidinol-phosphatase [Xenorhabdus eapokensis]
MKLGSEDDLRLAQRVAMEAATTALSLRESSEFQVTLKKDGSPVTPADIGAELRVRELIESERPNDLFFGEESGGLAAHKGRVWIVDPIDGTKNFIRGIPIWATLVALVEDGEPKIGVVFAPELKRCWWAEKGSGAYFSKNPQGSGNRMHVRQVSGLKDAYISTTAFDTWHKQGLLQQYQRLVEQTFCNRGFGDFLQHCLVAEGILDVAIEPIVAPWDVAALIPIVEEAGGICTDLMGQPVLANKGVGIASTSQTLHKHVIDIFGE